MQVMVWGSLRLICAAHVENLWSVQFHLRPHHVARDFQALLSSVRRAWERLASLHSCSLCRRVPAIVVDGKWCMQVSLCNDRRSQKWWDANLALGCLIGCVDRPFRGGKYCSNHDPRLLPDFDDSFELDAHREVVTDDDIFLEYHVKDGQWVSGAALPAAAIQSYELRLLPKVDADRAKHEEESCSKDSRRGAVEHCIGRKSGGLLIAVYPCLHIVGVRPMYSSESITQVVLFVWHVLSYLQGITWVLYDFACGVLRFLRNQALKRDGKPFRKHWQVLLNLRWVVDKLHFKSGHSGCKDPNSKYYEPSVNPYAVLLV